MTLSALIATDRQEFFLACENAFWAANTYANLSSCRHQEVKDKLSVLLPDILLIEAQRGEQAAQLLAMVAYLPLPRLPDIFVCVSGRVPEWEQLFLHKGALYTFDSEMPESVMVKCVLQLYMRYRSVEREENILSELSRVLLRCGFAPKHRGYTCLMESVYFVYSQPSLSSSLTKRVYPYIAKKLGTSQTRVEKNVRDAIHHAWENGGAHMLPTLLGCAAGRLPSNGQVIACLCEYLRDNTKTNSASQQYSTV